jgi:hypothetical protein
VEETVKYLYLDDERTPKTDRPWTIVRTMKAAIVYILTNGVPDYISFDHDLAQGPGQDGSDFAKWLVEHDLEMGGTAIPEGFQFNVHSANPAGAASIQSLLDNYLEFRKRG